MSSIGENIKYARRMAGMTQDELGKRIGIVGRMVSKWENGLHEPSLKSLCKIAEACETTMAHLIPPQMLGLDTTPRKCMTLEEYQHLAARTIDPDLLPFEIESHALHGMTSEIGEIHGLFQKVYQGHQLDKEHLKKELGDLMWFIAEYCTGCDWSLEDIARMNIEKLKERYPNGFDPERSLHRKEGDI